MDTVVDEGLVEVGHFLYSHLAVAERIVVGVFAQGFISIDAHTLIGTFHTNEGVARICDICDVCKWCIETLAQHRDDVHILARPTMIGIFWCLSLSNLPIKKGHIGRYTHTEQLGDDGRLAQRANWEAIAIVSVVVDSRTVMPNDVSGGHFDDQRCHLQFRTVFSIGRLGLQLVKGAHQGFFVGQGGIAQVPANIARFFLKTESGGSGNPATIGSVVEIQVAATKFIELLFSNNT